MLWEQALFAHMLSFGHIMHHGRHIAASRWTLSTLMLINTDGRSRLPCCWVMTTIRQWVYLPHMLSERSDIPADTLGKSSERFFLFFLTPQRSKSKGLAQQVWIHFECGNVQDIIYARLCYVLSQVGFPCCSWGVWDSFAALHAVQYWITGWAHGVAATGTSPPVIILADG